MRFAEEEEGDAQSSKSASQKGSISEAPHVPPVPPSGSFLSMSEPTPATASAAQGVAQGVTSEALVAGSLETVDQAQPVAQDPAPGASFATSAAVGTLVDHAQPGAPFAMSAAFVYQAQPVAQDVPSTAPVAGSLGTVVQPVAQDAPSVTSVDHAQPQPATIPVSLLPEPLSVCVCELIDCLRAQPPPSTGRPPVLLLVRAAVFAHVPCGGFGSGGGTA
jgi:hypothetical protein